jgi:hypothetical protein
MPWIGTKRIAFIPVYRSHAFPPDQIPLDWSDRITLRAIFEPEPTTGGCTSCGGYLVPGQ